MGTSYRHIAQAQAELEGSWEKNYFYFECERDFRRARMRALLDSLKRLIHRGKAARSGGQSSVG